MYIRNNMHLLFVLALHDVCGRFAHYYLLCQAVFVLQAVSVRVLDHK